MLPINILFIGDICGRPGREAVHDHIYNLCNEYNITTCIANCENAAGGFGVTDDILTELSRAGIDVFTSGNHVFSKREAIHLFDRDYSFIRPYNMPKGDPGIGYVVHTDRNGGKIAVINLLGRLFMNLPVTSPFDAVEEVLKQIGDVKNIIIDIHAEATSEKKALAYFVDGKVSAVLGTHTHVQTADETVLPKGTAYISDVGFSGAINSVLGADPQVAISKFTSCTPKHYVGAEGARQINAVVVSTDENGRAISIKRIIR